jgi:hypothetical protein
LGQDGRGEQLEPFETEALRMARAKRRLTEFELVERAVLLGLTVLLSLMTMAAAIWAGPLVGVAPAAGAVGTGGLLVARSRSNRP